MLMALAAGEIFAHTHNHPSVTLLVDGNVTLEVDGSTTPLIQGAPMEIDANVTHVLVNVGPDSAHVKCMHVQVGH